jgi:hypothetical protein
MTKAHPPKREQQNNDDAGSDWEGLLGACVSALCFLPFHAELLVAWNYYLIACWLIIMSWLLPAWNYYLIAYWLIIMSWLLVAWQRIIRSTEMQAPSNPLNHPEIGASP